MDAKILFRRLPAGRTAAGYHPAAQEGSRPALARAEAQEESLASRLLASEASAEELRRSYERRLMEAEGAL